MQQHEGLGQALELELHGGRKAGADCLCQLASYCKGLRGVKSEHVSLTSDCSVDTNAGMLDRQAGLKMLSMGSVCHSKDWLRSTRLTCRGEACGVCTNSESVWA